MRDRLLKRVFPLVLSLLMLIAATAFAAIVVPHAESYEDAESGSTKIDTNWWFQSIDVEIDVRRDKTLAVTETMRVGFIKGDKNTGLIRDIQRISQTTRIRDGIKQTGKEYIANLSDVEVTINGEEAKVTQSLYEQGQFHSVKMQLSGGGYFPATDQTSIENLEATLNTFKLRYVYDMGDDKIKGFDDLTFDVLGYAMDFTRNFHAKITFPEAVDENKVSFRTNKMKEFLPDAENGESVSVSGNTVELTAKPNKEHVGYTVQVLFEDGYFQTDKTIFWYYFLMLVPALAAIVAGGIIVMRFTSNNVVETVEFYPPKGMRAMRFAAVWRGATKSKDIAAVIAQWADEGFVRIYKDGDHHLIVRKLKSMPDTVPKEERDYFDTMFAYSSEFFTRSQDSERDSKLSKGFQRLQTVAENPNPIHNASTKAYVGIVVCMVLPFIALFVYYCILCASALPLFFCIFIVAGAGAGITQAKTKNMPIFIYLFPLMFTAIPMVAFTLIFYMPLYDYAGLIYFAPIWYVVLYVLSHFLNKRSEEVLSDYGKMLGFKRFLLTAELSRLEMQFEDDPDYFSHIIPYCLIMGIGKKVEKRFAALNVVLPEWADGIGVAAFSHFSHTLAYSSGMSSSSGGGGGGHGGSSGGGGGGGGSRGC